MTGDVLPHRQSYVDRAPRTGYVSLRVQRILMSALIVLVGVLIFVPFAWILISSLKPNGEVLSSVHIWWPSRFTLDNYRDALMKTPIRVYFSNSVIASAITIALNLPTGAMAAYAFSRFRFRGRNALMTSVLVTQLLPAAALVVPLFTQWSRLSMLNSPVTLGITYAGLALPLVILLLYGFMESIPHDLDEAAEIDGCTKGRAFWLIMVPLLRPGLAAAGVFMFNTTWQEFLLAVSLNNKQLGYTLPVGLYAFIGQWVTNWGGIMAMAVIIAAPVAILFTILQDQFISTLAGSVKG
jgi:ABC-type glycerol-3-phosphate transport system permease component